jgi:hypothetical protein
MGAHGRHPDPEAVSAADSRRGWRCQDANRQTSLIFTARDVGASLRPILWISLLWALLGTAQPAGALTFNVTFDASVGAAPAGFIPAFNDALQAYESLYSDPITINIHVGWGDVDGKPLGPGALGQSSTNLQGFFTYSQIRTALMNHASSADDATAVGSLGTADPTGGRPFVMANAEAKALGVMSAVAPGVDGFVGFASQGITWTFDPNNRAVPGAFDFIGVAEHEISEIMGRFGSAGTINTGPTNPPAFSPLDLFRYFAPGTRDLAPANRAYFSIDSGATVINTFNGTGGGDLSDWLGSTVDSYNAFNGPGNKLPLSQGDITEMDVIGYTLAFVPCNFSLSAGSATFGAAGGSRSVSVATSPTCTWNASTSASWISFGVGSGTGSGTMTFRVQPNATRVMRKAAITVADQTLLVSELGPVTRGDFDGDGKADITVFRPSTAIWYTRNSSTGTDSFSQWGLGGDVPVPGDYDGDGKTDIAVFRPSTGIWYIVNSSTGTPTFFQWGLSGDVPVPGDYDGDGKTDIAVFRPSTGMWYIVYSSTGTQAFFQWGLNGDVPVAADYDGDGRTDLAVFRPSTGIWYVVDSSTGTQAFFQWGIDGDVPVPGDYDGDGKSDIAVFRPATGIWYVMNSSTGTPGFFQWGLNGDVPVPGDYDGDRKTDIAVFRPSTGIWYIVSSSSGTRAFYQWGLSGDIPIVKP